MDRNGEEARLSRLLPTSHEVLLGNAHYPQMLSYLCLEYVPFKIVSTQENSRKNDRENDQENGSQTRSALVLFMSPIHHQR